MTPEQIISELPCDKRAVLISYFADLQAGTRDKERKRCVEVVLALIDCPEKRREYRQIAAEIEKGEE